MHIVLQWISSIVHNFQYAQGIIIAYFVVFANYMFKVLEHVTLHNGLSIHSFDSMYNLQ